MARHIILFGRDILPPDSDPFTGMEKAGDIRPRRKIGWRRGILRDEYSPANGYPNFYDSQERARRVDRSCGPERVPIAELREYHGHCL